MSEDDPLDDEFNKIANTQAYTTFCLIFISKSEFFFFILIIVNQDNDMGN